MVLEYGGGRSLARVGSKEERAAREDRKGDRDGGGRGSQD